MKGAVEHNASTITAIATDSRNAAPDRSPAHRAPTSPSADRARSAHTRERKAIVTLSAGARLTMRRPVAATAYCFELSLSGGITMAV